MISSDFGQTFNLQPIDGLCYNKEIELTDENYFNHLGNPQPRTGYALNGFFQHRKLLCDYRDQVLNLYRLPIGESPHSSNDVFIACRLGDCLTGPRTYCSMEYMENQLKASRHMYDKAYVTSDTISHPPLQKLMKEYDLTVHLDMPMNKILFAAQFNNLILSAGSFSYWMAYLSKAENITVYKTNQDSLQEQQAWDYNNNIKFSR